MIASKLCFQSQLVLVHQGKRVPVGLEGASGRRYGRAVQVNPRLTPYPPHSDPRLTPYPMLTPS